MTKKVSYEKSRLKELLAYMIEEHQPTCPLCGEQFKLSEVLPSRGSDSLTIHHLDGNHYNNSRGNRVLVHRECHKRHHTKNNINFWSSF
jgi:hypothetical protein